MVFRKKFKERILQLFMKKNEILKELKEYCTYYHLPLKHIVKVMNDLKVVPMLRGKSFEFTIFEILTFILPKDNWQVSVPNINAQSEIHDVDVYIVRKKDSKQIRVECKLSGKGSFRENKANPLFKVKCMRSRTLSDNLMATRMAKRYKVSREQILAHADNYRDGDFDFVITSMGNAFWDTENEMYLFKGTKNQLKILSELFPKKFSQRDSQKEFNKKTFNFMLFANSKDLVVKSKNKIVCTRRKCIKKGTNKKCGFIPNYPIVYLKELSKGKGAWKPLEKIERELDKFLDSFG